ncbi:MAG: hypothetical protein RSC59_06835 [Erysipelotrichaceae bacterium]
MNYAGQLFTLMKTKRKSLLLLLYFIIIIASVLLSYKLEYGSIPLTELNYMKECDPEMGLDFFYLLQDSGLVLFIFLSATTFLPNLITADFLIYRINKFDNFILTRTSNIKYNKSCIKVNFISTFILILLTQIIILITIQLFCFDLSFEINQAYLDATRQTDIFSNSLIISLIIYIVLSCIGYGVFSNLIFSLQAFVNNIYLYRTLGLCITLILYIGSAVITKLIVDVGGGFFIATLTYFFNITNLITPGIIKSSILNNTPILFYIGTMTLYYMLSKIFFDIKENKNYASCN